MTNNERPNHEPRLISEILEKMTPEMRQKQNALRYITAGNAVFTLESSKVNERYTYKMVHRDKDNICTKITDILG